MNAWHIVTSEYPPDVGGVSDYTRQVAEALAHKGDEVHVWCPRGGEGSEASGVHTHPELGRIRPEDLRRLHWLLDSFPAPRRILVQWVPHGFGYHSMNVWFCLWLAKRARAGDRVELMVHEPYLQFGRGPIRHALMACVHRVMTLVLLRAASRVWISTPGFEPMLRPYLLGRQIPISWLPVPSCVASTGSLSADAIRERYGKAPKPLVGHFGSYGSYVTDLLEARLPSIMDSALEPSLVLLGAGSDRYRDALVERHPGWRGRVHASGYVPLQELGTHIAACDLFIQPYADGITSRRTTAMACLSQGKPVVTTNGYLTEPFWSQTGAVILTDVDDAHAFVSNVNRLLRDDEERRRLGARGQTLYAERFAVHNVVATLRAA